MRVTPEMSAPETSASTPDPAPDATAPILQCRGLTIRYGSNVVIRDLDLTIRERQITAIIGPSGCGKSTLIRMFNRMNDFIPSFSKDGEVLYRGTDLYTDDIDPVELRRHVGMVFQKPNPFPKSIYQNIVWGPKINGYRGDMDDLVEESLTKAALWDEVKGDLKQSGLALSGGQQQRLCIARAIAVNPEIVLMDEPSSALDPIATQRIEDLMLELADDYTIVVVTHNMQQAARVSHRTAFMLAEGDLIGRLIEYSDTEDIFLNPQDRRAVFGLKRGEWCGDPDAAPPDGDTRHLRCRQRARFGTTFRIGRR